MRMRRSDAACDVRLRLPPLLLLRLLLLLFCCSSLTGLLTEAELVSRLMTKVRVRRSFSF